MSHHHPHQSSRQACIVDGDNLTRGGLVTLPDVSRVLNRLSQLTVGLPVTFALQRGLATTYMPAFVGLGWGIRFASMRPDAADLELLEAAADYIAHDVRTLVVASGDHAFAELAGQAQLHVLAYRGCLSRRLRIAATTVTYLDDLVVNQAA